MHSRMAVLLASLAIVIPLAHGLVQLPASAFVGAPTPPSVFHEKRVNIGFFDAIPHDIYVRVDQEGGQMLEISQPISLVVAEVKEGVERDEFIDGMEAYPDTRYAVPDVLAQLAVVPRDEYYDRQWGPGEIGVETAWDTELGNSNVAIGIVDTGVHCLHEDLANSCDPLSPDQVDAVGHGTFVAGIAAARINNGCVLDVCTGIAGLAQAKLWSTSVAGPGGHVLIGTGAAAIVATALVADIIQMSWGIPFTILGQPVLDCGDPLQQVYCIPLQDAIQFAHGQGAILVASAGNDDCGPVRYPAAYPEVIAVGAIESDRTRALFSNCGPELDLVTPGVDILSTHPNTQMPPPFLGLGLCTQMIPGETQYCYSQGTSFAAPHVSGAAALLWSACPGLTRDQVRSYLESNIVDLGEVGRDDAYGHGLLQVDAALAEALEDPSC